MTRNRLPWLVAIAAAALLAGCGTSTTDAASAELAAVRSDHGMVEFAHCMRAHGVNMRDPFHRPGHEGLSIDLPVRGPATSYAYKACRPDLLAVMQLKRQANGQTITPTLKLGLIRYAECMRTHAVPMLDPGPDGQLNLGNVPGISNGFGRYTPEFHAADSDCRQLLPPGVPDNGTGP